MTKKLLDGYNEWWSMRKAESRIFKEIHRGFRVMYFQGQGQYSYWTATYIKDSEWHSERLSSYVEVVAWIDEQFESEDFLEWHRNIWNKEVV